MTGQPQFTHKIFLFLIVGLLLYLEKPGIWQFRQKKLKKPGIWEKKNLEFFPILTCSVIKFRYVTWNVSCKQDFLSSSKFFYKKNTFKVALKYLFNVIILLNTVFNFKLNFERN